MGDFAKVLRWTYKNDLVEPLPELVLLLGVASVASHNFMNRGTSTVFENLTWSLDILILIFVGIAGVMSYSLAMERGQIAEQFLSLRVSRAKFVVLKWTSLFAIFVIFALLLDLLAFFLYLGYFPNVGAYSNWGDSPGFTFLIMISEQLVLLAFLNSFVMAVSFALRRTTVSLLVFLAFTLFSAGYLSFGTSILPQYLQLGYGDYLVVNAFSTYVFSLLYRPEAVALSTAPAMTDYLALAYRVLGASVLFLTGLAFLVRADLD
ncbi:MAG: hypothetical protein JRN56_03295 [Nitrososphaerota archaeon]|nr:hypothetical protein [Nitrososphaerota archaeon]MDG6916031.1 hypothetical protein [Nitrososphaerota archaeon]MDG6940523.1 hypothetical protein [Nitrososphaerota archaeon]MDG6960833.1 hypothetical protein [Nitrososphaerota archaeon]MDG6981521.1 hypothetical protein [Nitrososphaerota archaeon]